MVRAHPAGRSKGTPQNHSSSPGALPRVQLPLHCEFLEDETSVPCAVIISVISAFFVCFFFFFLLETKHHLNYCRGFSLLAQLALPHKSPTQTSSKRRRQHKHEIPSKGRKLKGPWSPAAGCALRTPDLDVKTGILETSTPVNLLSRSIVTELHNKSMH